MADGLQTGMDQAGRLKLMAWLSPGYPVGAYTYSHGLEAAVGAGDVHDAGSAGAWARDCLVNGAGRTDAILLSHAWRAETAESLAEIADLARALAPSAERLLETEAMGTAFGEVTEAAWSASDHKEGAALPYPVAVGVATAAHGVELGEALPLYLQAFVANLISAAVRLVPLGQTEGQRVLAELSPACLDVAIEAAEAGLDDIGGCAIRADIASMQHEIQTTRLFRT